MIPKFRAWDTYEKEMLENVTPLFDDSNSMMAIITDFQIKGSPGTSEIEIGSYDTTFNWDEFPYVIMQSTGLKDKNGVDVYQGDIIRCTRGCPHEVIWLEEYGGAFFGGMPAWYLSGLKKGYAWTGEEVIGNIYENPELSEGTE
ncbi:YopX family protein [Enterococcus faecalis]|uniref:YopX family protein n=1 Tax=Enterococcus faecalis TaxID=1351 RepID=UPI002DBA6F17|nr:YopX family protein [Enterococcus faecalis]MEB6043225.1 YopX family protein [Enterococcus faecalis]MEB6173017.1 YopX family protein [Enterococcus faecalis]